MSDKIIAYYRVSTSRQGISGLGLESQKQAVKDYARRVGASLPQNIPKSSQENLTTALSLSRLLTNRNLREGP